MLSDKWTFSLKILVMLLAVALVASSAMAQAFDTTLSVRDVSFADGNQVDGGSVEVIVKFGKVVLIDDIFGKVSLLVYNKFGGVIGTETATDGVAGTVAVVHDVPRDGKSYLLSFSVNGTPSSARLYVAEGIVPAAFDDDERSQAADIAIYFVGPDPTPSDPMPVRIEFANNLLVPADGFTGNSFDIIVTLSEEPKEGKFTKDHLGINKGTASDGVYLGAIDPPEGQTATGRSFRYHRFLFTITPKVEGGDLVIKIKSFEDQEKPTPNKYNPPTGDFGGTEGMDILTVKIGKRVLEDVIVVIEISVPKDTVIPGAGPLTPTQNGGGDNTEASAKAIGEAVTTPAAAVDTSVMIPEAGQVYISEVMFAGGGSLPQWIEISNGSRTEQVNLGGWTLTVENAIGDTDVSVGAKAVFNDSRGNPNRSEWTERYTLNHTCYHRNGT